MTAPVTLPLWTLILILLFAMVTFASHFLFPSVRWFFRRRAEKVVAQLNQKLNKPIEPFKLARRYDMIQRLVYDPQVISAIVDYARTEGVREDVAFEKARRYAREIVPSFSATLYFSFGIRLARWLSRFLYRIRVGQFDRAEYAAIDKDAAVVFVMNHRSNMDYVLVTHLASRAGALSYAVGEWARVWPLSSVIKMMGAYFIRRKARGALYRRVLARYVQMATEGGVTQAFFPEGGLSLTGAMATPRLGILNYTISGYSPEGRDVVFVPVALNYDRVLEDRFLIRADQSGTRKFRPPLLRVFSAIGGYLWKRMRGKLSTFGTASVSFGQPLSLRSFTRDTPQTADLADAVGSELMARIASVIPILPVPLVARAVLGGASSRAQVTDAITADLAYLAAREAPNPRRGAPDLMADGVSHLQKRRVLSEGETLSINEDQRAILQFYANSIAHHFPEG